MDEITELYPLINKVPVGFSAVFKCFLKGSVSWSFGGEPLPRSRNISYLYNGRILLIKQVQIKLTGMYFCIPENGQPVLGILEVIG